MSKIYYGKVVTIPSGGSGDMLQLLDNTTTHLYSVRGQKWLNDPDNRIFRYQAGKRSFTARKEPSQTGQTDYWYACRKVDGKLHKRYIGKSEDITGRRLREIALALDTLPEPRQKTPKPVDVTHQLSVIKAEVLRLQALVESLHRELGNVSSQLEAERVKITSLIKENTVLRQQRLTNMEAVRDGRSSQ